MSERYSKESEARAKAFLQAAASHRYEFFSGVPCSLLGALFAELEAPGTRAEHAAPATRAEHAAPATRAEHAALATRAEHAALGTRDYVPAVREDIAIGLAAGAHLGGKKAMVLMQNSGLGVAYNALASLNEIYEIPVLLVVSWRGEGGHDAPEHLRMGKVTPRVLEELEIPFERADPLRLAEQLARLDASIQNRRRPAALVAPKGVFA